MNLALSWLIFCFAFTTIVFAEAARGTGSTTIRNAASKAPPRPVIPDTFQAQVEAIFKNQNVGAAGALYFDKPNNIAAMDLLWQGDFVRKIYSFDTNEVITISGYSCNVIEMEDDPRLSFFPFTVDSENNRKRLAPPEEALYFQKSKYVMDTFDDAMESYMYQGYIDVLEYNRKNCSIIHRFSKTDFETATCDTDYCKPVLLSISVSCEGVENQSEDMAHIYKIFHFTESIQDESVFHPPPGVYCNKKETKSFPFLPMYFSFSYDIITKNVFGLQTLHKEIWYDGDMELLRLDGFEKNGLVHDIHIYDFYNEMSYVAIPELEETDRGTLPKGLSLELATLLPSEVFPRKLQEPVASPVFVGSRKVHGLEYDVWSVMKEMKEKGFTVVTEMYFSTAESEVDGEIIESGFQLSFLDIYMYSTDEESDTLEISEVKYIPINYFRSNPRDWSVFDVSSYFDTDEKRPFEISIRGPRVMRGSDSYGDFLEQLYLEIVTAASISVTRISKLEMLPTAGDPTDNITNFRGFILESPSKLGYDNQNNESDLNTAFSQLEEIISGEGLEFIISNSDGETQTYLLNSFRQVRTEEKDEKNLYSGGSVAAIAIGMLMVGSLVGLFALTASKGKKGNYVYCTVAGIAWSMFIVGIFIAVFVARAIKKRTRSESRDHVLIYKHSDASVTLQIKN